MAEVSSSRPGRIFCGLRPAAIVVIAGLGLASCGSMPSFDMPDMFQSKPTTTLLLIESNPAGAQAATSFGKTCTTPCTMQIGEGSAFTVTFTRTGYLPQTLTVHSHMASGGFTQAPSPVFDPPSLFPTLEPDKKSPAVARRASKPHA